MNRTSKANAFALAIFMPFQPTVGHQFCERDVFHTRGYASLIKLPVSERCVVGMHAASHLRLMLAVIFVSEGLGSCVFTRYTYLNDDGS